MLSSTFPYPPSRGGTQVRTFNLLKYLRSFPRLPPGCRLLNSVLLNPLSSNRAIAIQSPIIIDIEVELVGAKFNGQASIGFLNRIQVIESNFINKSLISVKGKHIFSLHCDRINSYKIYIFV